MRTQYMTEKYVKISCILRISLIIESVHEFDIVVSSSQFYFAGVEANFASIYLETKKCKLQNAMLS
jgi:hypothetical protein